MNRLMMTVALTVLMGFGACGDDDVKPGDLIVNWTHGSLSSTTCVSRGITKIQVRAIKSSAIAGMSEGACDDNARSLAILGLEPGNYKIEVEGFNADNKGIFLGVVEKFGVKEGKAVETAEIVLTEKPARIRFDWLVPESKCGGSDIKKVDVEIFYDGLGQPTSKAKKSGTCDAIYPDPDNPADMLTGFLFEDLGPDDEVVIVALGLDSAGKVISKVERAPFQLDAGDDISIQVTLDYCPGSPPVCP